jgi:uncharacterized damage-inducible protein DinB
MSGALLNDAFEHHVWATQRLIDACLALSPEQLETTVPGTYGPILDTLRHLVGSDSWYLFVITEGRRPRIDEDEMSLNELRSVMEDNGAEWSRVLAEESDADRMTVVRLSDGSKYKSPLGIRLAQALHHGTDHRSQVCTALTELGVEPPDIDLWAFGEENGRVVEVPATSD